MIKNQLSKRLSVMLFLVVALTALLSACGDTATSAPAVATTSAATTTSAAATTSSAATTTSATTTTAATTSSTTTVAATGGATTASGTTTVAATGGTSTASGTTTAAATGGATTTGATSAAGGNGVTINVAGTDVNVKAGGGKTFNPANPVTITIWDSQRGGNQAALVKLAADFHATHPNITIKWDNNNNTFSYGDILKKLQSAATAGGLPNMATGYENWVPGFVDSKTILGFNQFISGDYGLTQEQLQDIQPGFLARGIFPQYNNETYLFPFGNSSPALYYNKDILDKYNLQVPQTWDDLVKDSQTIAKQTSNATAGLVFTPQSVSEFVAGMYSEGCKIYDYGSKTWYFTDPTCVNHLQMYYDGVKNGYFKATDPTQQYADEYSFEKGEAAFWISSTSSRSYIDADQQKGTNGAKKFNWNAVVIPHAANVKPVDTLYGGGMLAFKGKSQDEDLATWEVAKYLASTTFTAQWAAQSGYTPVTNSALQDPNYKAFLAKNPHNGIPVEITKYATVSEPKIGQWQSIRDEFDKDVSALFQDQTGQATAASTMKTIQDKAVSLVK